MKAFFGMTAAVLLVVMMLFVSLPGTGLAAAGKVTLTEMVKIKKAADEAAQAAKAQAEKAKTDEEKRLAKQLVKQAEINAEVAGDLLEAVKAGEEIDREEAAACAAIAKAVHKAAGALAAGDADKAGDVLDRIAELGSSLPTAANARAEMQKADRAGNKQTFNKEGAKEKGNRKKADQDDKTDKDTSTYDEKDLCPVCHSLHCHCKECDKCGGKHPDYIKCPIACKNGEKTPDKFTISSCEVQCEHGSLFKKCVRTITFKKCVGGTWKDQYIIGTVSEKIGQCECNNKIFLSSGGGLQSVSSGEGVCGKCRHCDNFKCVPDDPEVCHYPSPASPNDCPCVNQ